MSQRKPTGPASSASSVRQDARAYLAQLRRERLQRLHKPGAAAPPEGPAPFADTSGKQEDITPKIGKRGVRVSTPASSPSRSDEALSHGAPQRQAALEARSNAREALRQGAAKARQAAHDAQQKMRDARLKQRKAAQDQRKAAAQQRAHVAAAASRGTPLPSQPPSDVSAKGTERSPSARGPVSAAAHTKRQPRRKAAMKALPPLTDIKGIGEAMTRRLREAGVHTLVDLACTNPDTLRERLGPVSTLANVEAWQDQANSLLK